MNHVLKMGSFIHSNGIMIQRNLLMENINNAHDPAKIIDASK